MAARSTTMLALIMIVTVSVSNAYESNGEASCWNGYFMMTHGMVYSSQQARCLVYRCRDGNLDIYSEGCEVDGQCHDVGSQFESECTTYKCNKENRGSYNWYQPVALQSKCKDHQGRCHNPGSTFALDIHGRIYNSCTCTASGQRVQYRCKNTTRN